MASIARRRRRRRRRVVVVVVVVTHRRHPPSCRIHRLSRRISILSIFFQND